MPKATIKPTSSSEGIKYVSDENPLKLTQADLDILKESLKEAPELEFLRFIRVCERTGLDPITRQIYGRVQSSKVKAKGNQGEYWRKDVVIITSIDGFRSLAERTGQYRGQLAPEWFDGNKWSDVFIPKRDATGNPVTLPDAARVAVLREGFAGPVYGIANFKSFAVFEKGEDKWYLNLFWKKMPEHQIAKVAEAQAFRKAFPLVLSDLYVPEEIDTLSEEERAEAAAGQGDHKPTSETSPAPKPAPKPTAAPKPPEKQAEPAKPEPVTKPEPAPKPEPSKPAPASKPPEDQSPFGDEGAPTRPACLDYKITCITHTRYANKVLDSLSLAELNILKVGWVDKFADSIAKDPAKVIERDNILAAIKVKS